MRLRRAGGAEAGVSAAAAGGAAVVGGMVGLGWDFRRGAMGGLLLFWLRCALLG